MITSADAQPKGYVKVQETLKFPASYAWGLLRDFGHWGTWSPTYLDMDVTAQSGQTITRSYRSLFYDLKVKPTIEETTLIDDTHYTLKYHTTQNSNTNLTSVKTTITLVPDSTGTKCDLIWESQTELTLIDDIADFMEEAYAVLFEKGQTHNCPYEKLAAAQVKLYGINIFGLSLYILLQSFKDKAFNLFSEKLVAIGGQALLGNNPETTEYQYAEYEVNTENMPKKVAGIPLGEVLPPEKFSLILKRLLEMSYITVSSFYSNSTRKFNADVAARTLVHMYGNSQDIKLTEDLIANWERDEEFCQQLLQGVNPMMIAKVTDLKKQVPTTMQNLTVTENGAEKSVEALAKEGRLFIVDYEDLHGLPVKNTDMTFYAPYLLCYRENLPNNQSRLNIVGIQLERQADTPNPIVYTPKIKATQPNLWTLAKMFVASADNQCHEFRYHLGQAHLCQEPVVVATHNRLPKTHPLRSLLQPHLDETIGINFLARQTLIAPSFAFTDQTFVVGTANGITLAGKGWQHYDFFGSSFPEQLKSRGFDREGTDGLPYYWYRQDGYQLWDILGNYATNVVNTYYKSDHDVAHDKDVQAWAEEMHDPKRANMKGFPSEIKTKALLAHVCQIIIWNGSALHSVVNFPQWPYLGFIKNRPNGLYIPMPKPANGQDITEADLEKALLPTLQSLFQILFSWLLSANATETTLLNLKALPGAISEKLQAELKVFAQKINERNAKLEAEGKTPYVFCLPENIACSVNI